MKTQTLLIILIFLNLTTLSQVTFEWPIKELDTARDVNYLTDREKDVVLELNKVRYNPSMYANLHIKWMEPYYSGKLLKIPGKEVYETHEGKHGLLECIKAMNKASSVPILKPSKGMTKACELLVYDQSNTGKTGHRGSGNSTPSDRVNKFGMFQGYLAENIHYGDCEPAFLVISLLIDDGVKSRGHRKNILSADFNRVGVAIGDHKKYGEMCVNTYATEYFDK